MQKVKPEQRHKGVSHHLGQEFLTAGFPAEAQAWLQLALEDTGYDERGDVLANLSRALDLQGRLQEARDRLQEACVAYDDQWDQAAMAKALLSLARLELRMGRGWEAAELCQEALRFLTGRSHQASDSAQARELLVLCLAAGGHCQPTTGTRKRPTALCWLESH
jgi:tetratricopeptide (TPR) repeat protein